MGYYEVARKKQKKLKGDVRAIDISTSDSYRQCPRYQPLSCLKGPSKLESPFYPSIQRIRNNIKEKAECSSINTIFFSLQRHNPVSLIIHNSQSCRGNRWMSHFHEYSRLDQRHHSKHKLAITLIGDLFISSDMGRVLKSTIKIFLFYILHTCTFNHSFSVSFTLALLRSSFSRVYKFYGYATFVAICNLWRRHKAERLIVDTNMLHVQVRFFTLAFHSDAFCK